jgi:hypothetical protein
MKFLTTECMKAQIEADADLPCEAGYDGAAMEAAQEIKAAAMKDAASIVDLHENLTRLLNVCEALIYECDDPGTEALAAVYCARQCLKKRQPTQAR